MESKSRNVAILIFDRIEVLDFAGPFEVFSVAADMIAPSPFNVYTVSWSAGPIYTRGRLSVNPDHIVADMPQPDILLIPGGSGTRAFLDNQPFLDWLAGQRDKAERILSVCTGARLLAQSGLLDGLDATTHHTAFDHVRQLAPHANVIEGQRFIDAGQIVTSAGVSAGIDMSLYIVGQLVGEEGEMIVREEMEYGWP